MNTFTSTTSATSLIVLMCVLAASQSGCDAFVTAHTSSIVSISINTNNKLFESTSSSQIGQDAAAEEGEEDEENKAPANPDYPNLPELKGDFDWDAKFSGDDDWITENVPGKIVLNEIELAKQVTTLNKLEEKFRKERLREEYDDYQTVGWVENAEILNSRFAMFFLAVGLFTESFTGVTMPGQVEEMLRILGFIGFD